MCRDSQGDQGSLLYWARAAESGNWPAHPHPRQEHVWLVARRIAGQFCLLEALAPHHCSRCVCCSLEVCGREDPVSLLSDEHLQEVFIILSPSPGSR